MSQYRHSQGVVTVSPVRGLLRQHVASEDLLAGERVRLRLQLHGRLSLVVGQPQCQKLGACQVLCVTWVLRVLRMCYMGVTWVLHGCSWVYMSVACVLLVCYTTTATVTHHTYNITYTKLSLLQPLLLLILKKILQLSSKVILKFVYNLNTIVLLSCN